MSIFETLQDEGFRLYNNVGEGGFAQVYLTKWKKYPDLTFAAKIIEMKNFFQYKSFLNEIQALSNLDHPHILKIYQYYDFEDYLVLILEYCDNGTMGTYINDHGPLELDKFLLFSKQILSALQVCHENQITHRDLKPENILIDKYGRARLSDFGLSNFHNDKQLMTEWNGSLYYLPPEVLQKRPYDPFKVDIWSLGVTFYVMICGKLPWNLNGQTKIEDQIIGMELDFPQYIPSRIRSLIKSMMCKTPEFRPTIHDILKNYSVFIESKIVIPKVISQLGMNKTNKSPIHSVGGFSTKISRYRSRSLKVLPQIKEIFTDYQEK